MKEFSILKNDAGQRADRFITKAVPLLPQALLQKFFRKKRIKLNGKPAARDARLSEGDMLQLYINDEFFQQPTQDNAFLTIAQPKLNIIFEDDNILLADKQPGLVVHSDDKGSTDTLITHIQAYLYQSGQWNPRDENAFAPALCNRIDRNTGGIVIAAKNSQALRIINEKIKNREITKYYLCVIHGKIDPPTGKLAGYIFKDSIKKQVYVSEKPTPGAKTAVTLYETVKTCGSLSLVECRLITGRTHQIRAQFAHAGHPLLGDGKYGSQALDRPYGRKGQALYAYKISFDFKGESGILDYLNNMQVQVPEVDFEKTYFL